MDRDRVARHWRSHLANFVRRGNYPDDIVLNHEHAAEYHVGLDQLDEVALTARDFDGRIIRRPRPRIILIPTPPVLPTHDMLITATRALHPHETIVLAQDIPLPDSPRSSISSSSTESVRSIHSHMLPIEGLQRCSVCMSNRKLNKFPARVTDSCYHPSATCLRCLEYHIANDHTTKMWDNIGCPECAQKLSYDEVKKFADADTFAHYDHLATRAALSDITNFVWCTNCPSGQLHSATCPTVTCNSCKAVTCFNHRIPWHTGLHCSQYDRLLHPTTLSSLKELVLPTKGFKSKKDDRVEKDVEKLKNRSREHKASVKNIKRVCKPCPGTGCGTMIFKIDGCRHMTCLKCSHEFCWRCKKNWFYGHKCWKFWGVEPRY